LGRPARIRRALAAAAPRHHSRGEARPGRFTWLRDRVSRWFLAQEVAVTETGQIVDVRWLRHRTVARLTAILLGDGKIVYSARRLRSVRYGARSGALDPGDIAPAGPRLSTARFTTVLGPGADRAHEFHLHVDLAERRNGYRLCQWSERKTDSD
jgi:hypothetical protein